MRTKVLSEHPDVMLADAERERRHGVTEQVALVESLLEERGQARSEGRWLAWLRLALAVSGAKREARRLHLFSTLPTAREQQIRAGRNAGRRVADQLSGALNDEWVLLRGYCNARGEIDALLLGPRGLFAIEEKYRSVRVFIQGDEWIAQQIDKYGRLHGTRFPIRGNNGRSPSEQVKEPVAVLSRWLSTNKRGTSITPVVLLSHLQYGDDPEIEPGICGSGCCSTRTGRRTTNLARNGEPSYTPDWGPGPMAGHKRDAYREGHGRHGRQTAGLLPAVSARCALRRSRGATSG